MKRHTYPQHSDTASNRTLFGASHLSDPEERILATRLADGDPEAIMELYDDIAPLAYRFALQLTKSKRRASEAVRRAFLHAIEQPAIFADRRLSTKARILLDVHRYARRDRIRGNDCGWTNGLSR